MKALIVFYSRTGTTKKLAREIENLLECDIEEIIDTKKRTGFLGYLLAGRDALQGRLTEIQELEKNPVYYELVIIGTPVWVNTMSSATRTFITQEKEHFRRVAFFASSGSGKSEQVFGHLEDICGKKPVAVLSLRTKEVRNEDYRETVGNFVEELAEGVKEEE